MALVVAPAEPADAYVSLTDAAAYHTARGNAAWAALASDTVREQCIRKATDYMVAMYGTRWKGIRTTSTQALDWPRYDVVANGYYVESDIVPTIVANACAELALKASVADLAPDTERLKRRTKVGPLEVEYEPGSSAQPKYTAIDRMLAAYLSSGSMNIAVVRA